MKFNRELMRVNTPPNKKLLWWRWDDDDDDGGGGGGGGEDDDDDERVTPETQPRIMQFYIYIFAFIVEIVENRWKWIMCSRLVRIFT